MVVYALCWDTASTTTARDYTHTLVNMWNEYSDSHWYLLSRVERHVASSGSIRAVDVTIVKAIIL
jgi:phage terminase large subunit-like protein